MHVVMNHHMSLLPHKPNHLICGARTFIEGEGISNVYPIKPISLYEDREDYEALSAIVVVDEAINKMMEK